MLIVIGNPKGGVGKTTTTVNLAVCGQHSGRSVLIVDANYRQGSAHLWANFRLENALDPDDLPAIRCVLNEGDLRETLTSYRSRFDWVIVDTPASDSQELITALRVADLVICPMEPGQFEISAIESMATIIDAAKRDNPQLQARVLINRASTHPSDTEVGTTRELIEGMSAFECFPFNWHTRKRYKDAIKIGAGVLEVTGQGKEDTPVREQLLALYEAVDLINAQLGSAKSQTVKVA